jgi:SAM-dependent methyltransferase
LRASEILGTKRGSVPPMERSDPAELAYDSFAGIYDEFTHRNDYEMWFWVLLPRLERFGLRTDRLLDVACGTGRAFAPMLRRGWRITACDISTEMVARAREKEPRPEEIEVADMRKLPVYGSFELVWALNDAVNYLLGDEDLGLALPAMGANLAPEGLLVFDCNTLRLFREFFEGDPDEMGGDRWTWRGLGAEGCIWEAELSGPGVETHRHRERHRPVSEVQAAMADAGLVPLAAMGQSEADGSLVIADDWDEDRDHKIIHVARRA